MINAIVAPSRPAVNRAHRADSTAAPSPTVIPTTSHASNRPLRATAPGLNVPANLWAGICARAPRLFDDGRRIEPVRTGEFRIVCPEDGAYTPHTLRIIGIDPLRYVCGCKCYRQWQGCKHGLGAADLVAATLAEYDARLRALPVLKLDKYTARLLHLGANPHLVCEASEALQLEYADALDQARWDLRACWLHTLNPACCGMALNESLRGYVPEWGAK